MTLKALLVTFVIFIDFALAQYSYGNSDYMAYATIVANVATADSLCQSQFGGRLASIPSGMTEYTAVHNYVRTVTTNNYMIGLTDQSTEGTYVWNDGSTLTYTNWAPGEPNGGGAENCVMAYYTDGKWNDFSCANSNAYVCKATRCFGVGSLLASVCSGHGTCVAKDTCSCSAGYAGPNCNRATYQLANYDIIYDTTVTNTFANADTYCRNNYGGRIAAYASLSEFNSVQSNIASFSGASNYWIGANDISQEGTWTWQDGSGSIGFSNWAGGEPNGGAGENCVNVYYNNGLWNDVPCSISYSFACKVMKCFGVGYGNASVCSGHGNCVAKDSCTCSGGYSGADCSVMVTCNGLVQSNPFACGGRGACVAQDTCNCVPEYTGSNCQYPVCNRMNSTNSLICNGTGICRSPSYQVFFHQPYGYSAPFGNNVGNVPPLAFRDFDIFATIYKTSAASTTMIWAYDRGSEGTVQFRLETTSDNRLAFYSTNAAGSLSHAAQSNANTILLNTWYTVQVERRGLQVSILVNGTQVATSNSGTLYSMADIVANRPNFLIGTHYAAGTGTSTEMAFAGLISTVRIVADATSVVPVCTCPILSGGTCNAQCSGICVAW